MDIKTRKIFTFCVVIAIMLFVAPTPLLLKKNAKPYDITSILDKKSEAIIEYKNFNKNYTSDNDILFLFSSNIPLDNQAIIAIHQIEEELKRTPHLQSVRSLFNSEYIHFDKDRFSLDSFISANVIKDVALETIDRQTFLQNTLISKDHKSTIIYLKEQPNLSVQQRIDLNKSLHYLRKSFNFLNPTMNSHLLGADIARMHFFDEVQASQQRILPILLSLIFLIILFFFGDYRVGLFSLFIMGIAYGLTAQAILLIQGGLDPFNSFSLLLVFVIATSDIIHYFSTLALIKDPWLAAREIRYPCFLTSLTTVVGLGSLCLSDIPPVRYFGLFSAIGISLCYLLTFTFLPWVLTGLDLDLKLRRKEFMTGFSQKLLRFVNARSPLIIFSFIAITVISILNIHKLNVSDDLYDKFVINHPLSQSNLAFQKSFNFLGPVELVVGGQDIDKLYFRSHEGETLLKNLTQKLGRISLITKVDSVTNVFDYVRSYLPESKDESFVDPQSKVSNYLNIFEDYGFLKQYFSLRENDTRITLYVSDSSSQAMAALKDEVSDVFKDSDFSQLQYRFVGFFPIRSQLMGGIFDSFMKSFLFSYSIIFIIFLLVLKSFEWAILAMIPNTLPLFFAIALMNAFHITIEYNLIVIFGIVLGVGVDDTIHFVLDFKKRINKGIIFSEALSQCYSKTVNALIGTTLIFVITMPTFLLTDIKIFYQMAFLLCFILIMALLSDILFLPAILKYFISFTNRKFNFKSIFSKNARSVS